MKPIFQPSVATFAQGMVVSVPIHYSLLKSGSTGKEIHDTLSKHYDGSIFVKVMPLGECGAKEAGLLERGGRHLSFVSNLIGLDWPQIFSPWYKYSVFATRYIGGYKQS
jgi:hypothetical protein